MKFGGIGVARGGDPVGRPIPGHGRTKISEGHPVFHDDGIPIAFEGHAYNKLELMARHELEISSKEEEVRMKERTMTDGFLNGLPIYLAPVTRNR